MYRFIRRALLLGLAIFACIAVLSGCTREIPTPTPIPDPVATSKYIHFTEPAIEERVRAILEKPTGGITPEDVLTITHLTMRGRYIRDISDLAYFTNLVELDLSKNDIMDIGVLAKLTKLTSLSLQSNDIEDFAPLSALVDLTDLKISVNRNASKDLDSLSGLTNLTSLIISDVTNISAIAMLTKLEHLTVTGSPYLESIEALGSLVNLKTLNLTGSYSQVENKDLTPLSKLPNLYSVDFEFCYVDIEEVGKLTQVRELNLDENNINEISPLANLKNLEVLKIGQTTNGMSNRISDLTPLESLTNLRILEITNCQISDISPLQNLTNLKELNLSNNYITDITPLENLTDLTYLMLHHNDIENFDVFRNHVNLKGISFNSKQEEMENTLQEWIPSLEYMYRKPYTNEIDDCRSFDILKDAYPILNGEENADET